MCIGETGRDTLSEMEQMTICDIARGFPAHEFSLRHNESGITWAVLSPRGPHLPRVTICRIDPCLIVMVESDRHLRSFRSVPTIDAAADALRAVVDEAFRSADASPTLN